MASQIYNANTMSKSDIKKMQQALVNAGYDVGSSGVDGIWGKDTAAALSKYKAATGGSNTYGTTVGNETLNKLYGKTSSGSSSSSSSSSNTTKSYSSSGSSGGSTKTGSNTTSSTPFSDAVGSKYEIVSDYSAFSNAVYEKAMAAKAKGKDVDMAQDNNGVWHYTTKGEDRLNSILDYYNNSENPIYTLGDTTYYLNQTPASTVQVYSSTGNYKPNASLVKYANGTVGVTYAEGSTPEVGDFIQQDKGTYIYYVEDEDGTGYWASGTPSQYAKYVSDYVSAIDQSEKDAKIAALEQQLWEAVQAQNDAAIDASVEEIKAELENGTEQYNQDAEEAYLQKLKAQQTQTLQNAYQGDLGGIGTKQYSDVTANYDQQMLQIALEKENFVNRCNQQINQLKAEGRLQEAELLSEWAQAKIDRYDEDYKWYEELKLSKAAQALDEEELQLSKDQLAAEIENADREYYYNRAVAMLEKGAITSDALEVLGVDSTWAKKYADQINSTAATSLEYAKAQLDYLLAETSVLKSSSSGSSSSASSSGTYVSAGKDKDDDGKDKDDDGENDEYPYGSVTIHHANGSSTEVALDSNDEIPDGVLKDGDYCIDKDGNRQYYNPKTGDFQDTVPKTATVYNKEDWLDAFQSLTGLSGYTASEAKKYLSKAKDDALAKRDLATTELKKLEHASSSPRATVSYTYTNPETGKSYTVTGSPSEAKQRLNAQYNKYDKLAGSYQTLLNKYPS